jgi:DNA sulfur modification protein DndC
VLHCDTGSDNPIAAFLAARTLEALSTEAAAKNFPIVVEKVAPEPSKRLLVRIAGRGYPPPNSFFRWCTKDIRIRPVERFLSEQVTEDDVIVLGVRRGESRQRDRSFGESLDGGWAIQREGVIRHKIFMPIVNLTVEDVWDGLFWIDEPRAVDPTKLWNLYRDASGECPTIRLPESPPCGQGRFGCWLCTVVRRDRSAERLVEAGHLELQPGPFRLNAREQILNRLLLAQRTSGLRLLSEVDHAEIAREWNADRCNPNYREDAAP